MAGEIAAKPQDDTLATHAAKITRDMGRIDWSQPATQLWNRARAFTPWPGVFTRLDGKLLKLLEVEPADADCPGRASLAKRTPTASSSAAATGRSASRSSKKKEPSAWPPPSSSLAPRCRQALNWAEKSRLAKRGF